MRRRVLSRDEYVDGIRRGDRVVLARAITLVESLRDDDESLAQDVLGAVLSLTGGAYRVGITGPPGVGKSTFIEGFGCALTARGLKVAVLAVDPTSSVSGGSILGDKTRMQRLSVDPLAFVRPSPSGGTLGGVARRTRETMLLCEAAGHDVVLVETVGVGQSETIVAGMVDFFMALMLPGAGDELQGIKKGILELADLIAVNKADGDNRQRAELARREYAAALRYLTPIEAFWSPPVRTCSGLTGDGLEQLWSDIVEHREKSKLHRRFDERRREQRVAWFRQMLDAEVLDRFFDAPGRREKVAKAESSVASMERTPIQAIREVFAETSPSAQPPGLKTNG